MAKGKPSDSSAAQHTPFEKDAIHEPVLARFEALAASYPNNPALKSNSRIVTYGRLNQMANQLASEIIAKSGGKHEAVISMAGGTIEAIASILGILKAGKLYICIDPKSPSKRIQKIISNSQASLVIADGHSMAAVEKFAAEHEDGASWQITNMDELTLDVAVEDLRLPTSPDTLMCLYYTSGSTGQPKGAQWTQRNMLHRIWTYTHDFELRPTDRISFMLPTNFIASVVDIFGALLNGAQLSIYNRSDNRLSELARWLEEEEITFLHPPIPLLRQFLEFLEAEASPVRFYSVRAIYISGQRAYKRDIELAQKYFPEAERIVYGLGSSEVGIATQTIIYKAAIHTKNVIPVGFATVDKQILILDESGQPLGDDQPGEIAIRSKYLASGYWQDAQLTQKKFITDPESGEEVTYLSGDMGINREKTGLEIHGREDYQIKIRGYRVEFGEVEIALSELPGIGEAVVSSHKDGAGNERMTAYLVSATLPQPTISSMRTKLSASLPDYMIPAAFVFLDEMPRSPNGKIDRAALPEPDDSRPELAASYRPGRTPVEEKLTTIWSSVLGIKPVGVQDNFFDLGGNSIQAAQIFSKIERQFNKRLPISSLLQAPTIAQISQLLDRDIPTDAWRSLVSLQPEGALAPLFCMAARDGGVMVYRELAILLGKDHPVYGLRARGMGGEDLPFNRLEDMAAHYIAEMRTVQPHGPYYLAGYSSGGLTAYEIAQQLLQAGEEIAGLILLDTYGIGYPQKLPMSGLWHNNIYHSFEKIAVHRENLAKMILPEKITYLKSRLADRVQFRRKVWEERRRALFDPVFRRARQVRNANYQARFGYQPAPYPGDILFIRAERQPRGIQTDPKLGWGELFTGNLEIFEASGHHYAIMFEPGVRAVANKIKEYLATHQ